MATSQEVTIENKLLHKKVRALRQWRDVRIIMVAEPNGHVVGVYSIPTSVYEANSLKINDELRVLSERFNQSVQVEIPVPCETLIELKRELGGLNQVDDKE